MKKILFIGGGTGISSILKSIREIDNKDIDVSAVISMFDSGGSTGLLRKEFKILPMGDIRQVMLSLSSDSIVKNLFGYRFENKYSIKAHNLGNLIITALRDIYGNEKLAFKEFKKLLEVKNTVVPITWEQSNIHVKYENGKKLDSEHRIDDLFDSEVSNGRIEKIWLYPKVKISEDARKEIELVDYIVIGPGDLYLSIICNMLVEGFSDAIAATKAKIIYIPNLANKMGQSEEFTLQDYVDEINKYLVTKTIDYILVNSAPIPDVTLKHYIEFNSAPPIDNLEGKNIIRKDLLSDVPVSKDSSDKLFRGFIRHDSLKTLNVIFDLVNGNLH